MSTSVSLPIQHAPNTWQFKCVCGTVITFAPNSTTYSKMVNLSSPGPGIKMGECPNCGQKHWTGKTSVPR